MREELDRKLCDTHRKGYNDITKWNKMSISMCNNDITK